MRTASLLLAGVYVATSAVVGLWLIFVATFPWENVEPGEYDWLAVPALLIVALAVPELVTVWRGNRGLSFAVVGVHAVVLLVSLGATAADIASSDTAPLIVLGVFAAVELWGVVAAMLVPGGSASAHRDWF